MPAVAPLASPDTRFRALFENTSELIVYQNEAAFILDANPAFLTLVQKTKEQVVNHRYDKFLSLEARGLYREKLAEAFTGQVVRFEAYTAQGSSAPRHWDVVLLPVCEGSQVVGVQLVSRDITEKTQQQQELLAHNTDLQQFTYIVSHNLRAPLANALGLADMLGLVKANTPEFESARTLLQTSLHQLDQVLLDINTILLIRDQVKLAAPEEVLLADVVTQVQQSLHAPLHDCGGTLRTIIPAGFRVRGNRAYLYSIFYNLLSNAIKYRDARRPLRLGLTATQEPEQGQVIVVADNGLGIDLARAGADVFKLYQRFHPQYPGRGVGLYLTKTHVESLGGGIKVSSVVGEGTQFTITFR
ncbi:hypothetical protein GCM10027422_35400 [Hymenobacter arcticus]